MRTPVVCLIACGVLTLVGCGTETAADHMQEHFARVNEVKNAVIGGDLEALREPAGWLAEHEAYDGLPGDWQPYVAEMQRAASLAAEATELAAAAQATAQMGLSCGTCHAALDEGAQFGIVAVPEAESQVVSHMLRHEWAVDRLWEGLIGPSDDSWMAGVDGLEEAPLRPAGQAEELAAFARRVHEIGEQARDAADPATRAQLLGDLFVTCANCHQRLGTGPATRPYGVR